MQIFFIQETWKSICIFYHFLWKESQMAQVIAMFNSSPPSAAFMRQWTWSSLVQVMACRLFGAKPLPEPMLAYCQLDYWEHISMKFEFEFYHFHSRKCNWKCCLSKWWPFFPGGNELTRAVWDCNICLSKALHQRMFILDECLQRVICNGKQ